MEVIPISNSLIANYNATLRGYFYYSTSSSILKHLPQFKPSIIMTVIIIYDTVKVFDFGIRFQIYSSLLSRCCCFLTGFISRPSTYASTYIPYKHMYNRLWETYTFAKCITTSTQVIKVRQHQKVALHADMVILLSLRGQKSKCRCCQVL